MQSGSADLVDEWNEQAGAGQPAFVLEDLEQEEEGSLGLGASDLSLSDLGSELGEAAMQRSMQLVPEGAGGAASSEEGLGWDEAQPHEEEDGAALDVAADAAEQEEEELRINDDEDEEDVGQEARPGGTGLSSTVSYEESEAVLSSVQPSRGSTVRSGSTAGSSSDQAPADAHGMPAGHAGSADQQQPTSAAEPAQPSERKASNGVSQRLAPQRATAELSMADLAAAAAQPPKGDALSQAEALERDLVTGATAFAQILIAIALTCRLTPIHTYRWVGKKVLCALSGVALCRQRPGGQAGSRQPAAQPEV
jgi:hypothetical protein